MIKLQAAYAFFVAHWAVISTVLAYIGTNVANSLMSNHPTEAGYIRRAVNLVSVTTSADFPAWLAKLPMTHGPLHSAEQPHVLAIVRRFPPAAAILIMAGFAFHGCAALKATATNAGTCILSNLPSDVTSALPSVLAILESGSTDAAAQSQLEGLGVQLGISTVECAVQAAITQLFGSLPKTAADVIIDSKTLNAIKRAQGFLNSKHIVPVVK